MKIPKWMLWGGAALAAYYFLAPKTTYALGREPEPSKTITGNVGPVSIPVQTVVIPTRADQTVGRYTYTTTSKDAISQMVQQSMHVIRGWMVPAGPASAKDYGINANSPIGPYVYVSGGQIMNTLTGKIEGRNF